MYLLKLALRPWRLAMFSQVFSAFAVGVLLFLIGFLFWMQHGLRSVLVRLEGEQVLTAYISNSVTEANEEKLLEAVKGVLVNGHGAEVKLVNTTEFIKLLKPQYPDLARELQGLGTDMVNVIPRYISVAGMLNSSVLREIKTIAGIESAESSKDRYRHIIGAFSTLRWVLRILIVGVSIALFTGLIHLSRTNGYLHRDALGLLKFWGASKGTLVFPGVMSGLLVGLLGGLIAWGSWVTVGVSMTQHVRSLSVLLNGIPTMGRSLELYLFLAGVGVGPLAGLVGNFSFNPLSQHAGAPVTMLDGSSGGPAV